MDDIAKPKKNKRILKRLMAFLMGVFLIFTSLTANTPKVEAAAQGAVLGEKLLQGLMGLIFAVTGVAVYDLTKEQLQDALDEIFKPYVDAMDAAGVPTLLESEIAIIEQLNNAAQTAKQGIYDFVDMANEYEANEKEEAIAAIGDALNFYFEGWSILYSNFAKDYDIKIEPPYTINAGGIQITPERFAELQANVLDTTGLPSYSGLFQSTEITGTFYNVDLTNYKFNYTIVPSFYAYYYLYPVQIVNGKAYTPKYYIKVRYTTATAFGYDFCYFDDSYLIDGPGVSGASSRQLEIECKYDPDTGIVSAMWRQCISGKWSDGTSQTGAFSNEWYNMDDDSDVINYSPAAKQGLYIGTCAPNQITEPFVNTKDVISTIDDVKEIVTPALPSDVINIGAYPLNTTETITASDVVTVTKVTDVPSTDTPALELPEDFPNIQAPKTLWDKFPFSLPFDLYNILTILEAEPEAPVFEIPFKSNDFDLNIKIEFSNPNQGGKATATIVDNKAETEDVTVLFDLGIAQIVIHTFLIVGWIVMLIFATNKMIGR